MSTQSPLLNLPGELRNRIYEFVLSTPPSSTYHLLMHHRPHAPLHWTSYTAPSHRYGYFRGSNYEEFNQLKYVNKQLYSETAGLESKYNTFDFKWRGIAGPRDPRRSNKHKELHYTTFKKGELADVGIDAESYKHRLQILWQHAKTMEESN